MTLLAQFQDVLSIFHGPRRRMACHQPFQILLQIARLEDSVEELTNGGADDARLVACLWPIFSPLHTLGRGLRTSRISYLCIAGNHGQEKNNRPPFLSQVYRVYLFERTHFAMAETITIPSPSVFLRASPDPTQLGLGQHLELETEANKFTPVKKRTTNRKKAAVASSKPRRDGAAVAKPKQSKSRNGRPEPHAMTADGVSLSVVVTLC